MFQRYFSFALFAFLVGGSVLSTTSAQAQTDLLGDLEKTAPPVAKREVVQATFKGTHIINSQTVEIQGPGTLNFLIQHRFGTLNEGPYTLFGFDRAQIRLSLEYGLANNLSLGGGRSSLGKTYDGFLKYRAIRQTSGAGAVPVSVTLLASAAVMTTRFTDSTEIRTRSTASRLSYTYQALIARKFSPELSVQLMPTLVHRNYVRQSTDHNDVYAMGAGFRQKITKRTAITGDYFYLLPSSKTGAMRNALGLGFDIESGGHVFQLHVTNAQGMSESNFISDSNADFFAGGIYFGFAINRNFTLKSNLH